MFLGSRVDDALSVYHRHQLAHEARPRPAPRRLPRPLARLAEERAPRRALGARARRPRRLPHRPGGAALARELLPARPPVAVQRKLEYALAPGLEWTIQGFLDLETLRPRTAQDMHAPIVDYKVKNTLHSQAKADHDPQAGLYLAGRWLAGDPAHEFCFAQIGKPGKRRKTMTTAFVMTRRTAGQLRAILARIAQAASQIDALYDATDPTRRGGSPTPAAGSARPAIATLRPLPRRRGPLGRQPPPPAHSTSTPRLRLRHLGRHAAQPDRPSARDWVGTWLPADRAATGRLARRGSSPFGPPPRGTGLRVSHRGLRRVRLASAVPGFAGLVHVRVTGEPLGYE